MCNYFSIGAESRAGIGFDRNRTDSICCNKVVYFWEGMKKMFCCYCGNKKTLKIKEIVDYVIS